MARDIGEWLEGLGLDAYLEALLEYKVDLARGSRYDRSRFEGARDSAGLAQEAAVGSCSPWRELDAIA